MTINYLAVFIATFVFYILGAVYFTVFEKQYIAAQETTKEKLAMSPKWGAGFAPYIIAFIFLLVLNTVFANFIAMLKPSNPTALTGAWLGLQVWLGFSFPTLIILNAYENKTKELTFINGLYFLIGLVLSGIILTIMR